MQISDRLTGINGSEEDDGWGLFYKAQALKAAGHKLADLTIGDHDIRTDPSILKAIHNSAMGGHTGYASVPGVLALRQEIAARIAARTGVATTPDNIVITAGGQAALYAAHVTLCDHGDTAPFIDPYYATYPSTMSYCQSLSVGEPAPTPGIFRISARTLLCQSAEAVLGIIATAPSAAEPFST